MDEYYIAWWNLENLFDEENSTQRPDHVKSIIKNELKGWTPDLVKKKTSQLAKIIKKMNDNNGPDIIGVCEVENKPVMDLLKSKITIMNRDYKVAHHDTSDARGIDVAFVYDEKKFTFVRDDFHVILKRTATRDLYRVELETKSSGDKLILIGNHWPARTAGVLKSEPYRMIAAETLGYWNEKIIEKSKNEAIIALGDFNDEPFNRSIMEYALGYHNEKRVKKAQKPALLNLMWPLFGEGKGTYYHDNIQYVLDQFMVSKGIVNGKSGFKLKKNQNSNHYAKILMFDELYNKNKTYPVPKKFGRPSKGDLNKSGYSDHYPISMILEES
jgi:hypothetical protein